MPFDNTPSKTVLCTVAAALALRRPVLLIGTKPPKVFPLHAQGWLADPSVKSAVNWDAAVPLLKAMAIVK